MKPVIPSASLALGGLLAILGCANSEVTTMPGSGGSTGTGTAGTNGGGTAGTNGGGTAGTNGGGTAGTNGGGTAGTNGGGTAGTSGGGTAGTSGGGTAGTNGGGTAGTTGGTAGRGGTTGTAGATGTAGRGGTTGTAGRGGTTGTAGRGGTTGTGGGTGGVIVPPTPLDCGPNGYVVENHGPSSNRVTYVVLGDGYTSADLGAGGVFERHIAAAMLRRFSPNATPYDRYRNFVNICGIKIVSTGAICGSSALGCCGSDSSRLANCNTTSVNSAFSALPSSLNIDWRAVMLNGSSWWNSGGITMYWSGGNTDASGAALHEGGHGFHQLADEYGGTNGGCTTEYQEVNSTANMSTTAGKWDLWLGYNQAGATGMQIATNSGFSRGSRYCDTGQYRPSDNSMMNSLFCNNSNQATCRANTAYNSVSREQMVMSIWKFVHPIDSTEPAAGAVTSPGVLKVNVIDPAVISVDWTIDGTTMTNAGTTFDTSTLGAGSHTISAKAYDNAGMDLVRYKTSVCPSSVTGNYCHRTAWKNSIQTVMWTFTK